MKKRRQSYLEFYQDCMEVGFMPHRGLCNCLKERPLNLFIPTDSDVTWLRELGWPRVYWGYGMPEPMVYSNWTQLFTPLRQNIVLFLAAMNNEL